MALNLHNRVGPGQAHIQKSAVAQGPPYAVQKSIFFLFSFQSDKKSKSCGVLSCFEKA